MWEQLVVVIVVVIFVLVFVVVVVVLLLLFCQTALNSQSFVWYTKFSRIRNLLCPGLTLFSQFIFFRKFPCECFSTFNQMQRIEIYANACWLRL